MALKQGSAPALTPTRLPAAYREDAIPPLASENFDDVVNMHLYISYERIFLKSCLQSHKDTLIYADRQPHFR